MNLPETAEKWTSAVNKVTLGAKSEDGGTRTSTVTIGGATAFPFLAFEGDLGCRPAIAVEIWDGGAEEWPEQLRRAYGDVMSSPGDWARKAVDFGAELICLRLMAAHPDGEDRSPEQCANTVVEILQAVGVPLVHPDRIRRVHPGGGHAGGRRVGLRLRVAIGDPDLLDFVDRGQCGAPRVSEAEHDAVDP